MIAEKMKAMLERRRARFEMWAKEFGFAPPPANGDWDELKVWENDHAADLERADILSEMKRIDERYAAK